MMDAWHSFQPLPKLTLGHSKKNATKRQPMGPLLWPASNQRIRGYFRWTWRGVEGGKVIAASIAAIPRSLASREIQFNGRTCGKNPRGRGPDLSIHIVVEEFLIWIREGCVLIGICNAKNICNSVKVWSFCRSICDGVVSSLEIQRVVSEVFWDVSRFKYQICK